MARNNPEDLELQRSDIWNVAHPNDIDLEYIQYCVTHLTVELLERFYQSVGGELLVSRFTMEDQDGNTAILQAIRYGHTPIPSILEIFNSLQTKKLLGTLDNRGQNMIKRIHGIARYGAKTCRDILLRQSEATGRSVLTEISESDGPLLIETLKVFGKDDLKTFLSMSDAEEFVVVRHVLNSCNALEAVGYVYDFLGADSLCEILCLKRKNSWPIITTMNEKCMKVILPLILNESRSRLVKNYESKFNTLHYILMSASASSAVGHIVAADGKQKCMALLLDKNTDGETVLSLALERWGPDCFASIMGSFAKEEIREMLSSRDEKNRSIMYHLVSSDDGNQLLKFLSESLPLEIEEIVTTLLCTEDMEGYSYEDINSWLHETGQENGQRDWMSLRQRLLYIFDQVSKKCCLLFHQPSILVISMKIGRESLSSEESDSICKAFQSLKLKVTQKFDLTEDEIFDVIEDQQSTPESKSCQIVVMMSHGSIGSIYDKDMKEIAITKLIEKMGPDTHAKFPKVLILQCCQKTLTRTSTPWVAASGDQSTLSLDDTEVVNKLEQPVDPAPPSSQFRRIPEAEPFHLDRKMFCVMTSCAANEESYRNKYIPCLANKLEALKYNEDLYSSYQQANNSLNCESQTPLFKSTLRQNLCLRNVFKTWLARKSNVDDLPVTEVKNFVDNP